MRFSRNFWFWSHQLLLSWIRVNMTIFTGDTLFSLSCGKLFEGTPDQMALAIVVVLVTTMHWLASMVGKPEPILEDDQESVDLNPSASLVQEYDVFLSFRGIDTRTGFISHLYHELQKVSGIKTFKDDREFNKGDPMFATLLKAIEESKFAIIVLSKNYAGSAWCLEELTEICRCMKENNRILPVFFDVTPSDVRFQKGCFKDGFTKHEALGRQNTKKVRQWREALEKVASLSGWNAQDFRTERDLLEDIVNSVCSKVRHIENESIISSEDIIPFEATKEAMDKVMEALKNEHVTTVGVYGMAGVGKSAMMELISAQATENGHGLFGKVILASISENPDFRTIQGTLADMLGVKLKGETVDGRARTLRKKIASVGKILIILDNIWNDIDLTRSIGIPKPSELKNCKSKVLLTTRTMKLCHDMHCQERIHLTTLNEKDSWNFFVKEARRCFDTSTFYEKAREVARECAGLPVALKVVAKILGDKDPAEWNKAADRLKVSQPLHPEDNRDIYKCIKLSYDYLKSDVSKSCFLLCCLFPENYDIKIEDLLNYGIGIDLFQESNIQNARGTIHTVVKSLKDSGLLLDANIEQGYVRMHDVFRDFGISISVEYFVRAGFELDHWPLIDARKFYTAISLMRNKIPRLPEELVFPELRILLLRRSILNEIPVSSFIHLKALRVLDLSYNAISLLPTSLNLLTNLRTLYLDGCMSEISNISLLGQLKELEILSMRELPLLKLPKEIGQLTTLRKLDITSQFVKIVPSEVIANLIKLEELCMQCKFADWRSSVEGSKVKAKIVEESGADGAKEETNACLDELTRLSCLHTLKVFISDAKCLPTNVQVVPKWENFDIYIGRDPSIRDLLLDSGSSPDSKALTLDTTMETLPKWFKDVVTKKTEKLQYRNCRGLGNVLAEYYEGTLHALKHLHVIHPGEKLEQLMTPMTLVRNEPVFENLEELHLDEVTCLKELCVGQLPLGSLCNLRLLKVKHCYELVGALLPSQLLQRLQNLEKLICEEIDELEFVFGCEGLELEQITSTKLIEMRLKNLGKLQKIWNGPAPCAIFQNLQSLVVSGCFGLKNLFTADVAQCLWHLEDLSVELCPLLDSIIEASKETVDNKIVFPELKKLALIQLPRLTRLCSNTGTAIEYPILEWLYVERCPQFSTSQNPTQSSTEFGHCTEKIAEKQKKVLMGSEEVEREI